jgi:hypothetical protein
VGPRAALDTVGKRKIPSPRRESNPRTPIVQPVAQSNESYTHHKHNYLLFQVNSLTMLFKLHNLCIIPKVTVNLSLCLTKYYVMETYPVLN